MDNIRIFQDHNDNLQIIINFTNYLEYKGSVSFLFAWPLSVSVLEQQCVESHVTWDVISIIIK
jgi:hypothetical protein